LEETLQRQLTIRSRDFAPPAAIEKSLKHRMLCRPGLELKALKPHTHFNNIFAFPKSRSRTTRNHTPSHFIFVIQGRIIFRGRFDGSAVVCGNLSSVVSSTANRYPPYFTLSGVT